MRRASPIRLGANLTIIGTFVLVGVFAVWLAAELDDTVAARGRIDFTQRTPVTTRVAARIDQVRCHEGQLVHRGDVIFELDAVELRARRDQSADKLHGLKGELEHLREILRLVDKRNPHELAAEREQIQALAAEERTAAELRRTAEELYRQRLKSLQDLTLAQLAQERATARRKAQQETVETRSLAHRREREEIARNLTSVTTETRLAEVALELAEQQLADATVRAPIDGYILTANPERLRGLRIDVGATIVEMAEPEKLQFVIHVDERDVGKITPGQPALLCFDAFPFSVYGHFAGSVAEVSHDPIASASRDKTVFRVLIAMGSFEAAKGSFREAVRLKPGLSGEGNIVVRQKLGLGAYLLSKVERHLPKNRHLY